MLLEKGELCQWLEIRPVLLVIEKSYIATCKFKIVFEEKYLLGGTGSQMILHDKDAYLT